MHSKLEFDAEIPTYAKVCGSFKGTQSKICRVRFSGLNARKVREVGTLDT